jgi:rhodanese-related sulfurtransferase
MVENANQAFARDYLPLARHMGTVLGQSVNAILSRELSREIVATRSGSHDIILGPAHVINSAVRYGYAPVAAVPGEAKIAFVTRSRSGIHSLGDLKGKVLGLPSVESLASFVALGEMNVHKLLAKEAGVVVKHFRSHDIAMHALEQGFVDAVAVDADLAHDAAKTPGTTVFFESPPMSRIGLAVNTELPPETQGRLRDWLLGPRAAAGLRAEGSSITSFRPLSASEFAYLGKLTYLTPTFLPGATVVSAEKVADLMKGGVICFDVRTDAEYKFRHIARAQFLPYAEHSKKEVGFDRTQDKFALTDTVKDKNAPLIFACNGEECWKSYKATTWAIAEGYKTVYWFRGGIPEWRNRHFQTD